MHDISRVCNTLCSTLCMVTFLFGCKETAYGTTGMGMKHSDTDFSYAPHALPAASFCSVVINSAVWGGCW